MTEISFNSLILVKFKKSLYTPKNIRFRAELIPLDVIVNGRLRMESRKLAKKHTFSSKQYKGPFSEHNIYFTLDLANSLIPVLPGEYILKIYYIAQERLIFGIQS